MIDSHVTQRHGLPVRALRLHRHARWHEGGGGSAHFETPARHDHESAAKLHPLHQRGAGTARWERGVPHHHERRVAQRPCIQPARAHALDADVRRAAHGQRSFQIHRLVDTSILGRHEQHAQRVVRRHDEVRRVIRGEGVGVDRDLPAHEAGRHGDGLEGHERISRGRHVHEYGAAGASVQPQHHAHAPRRAGITRFDARPDGHELPPAPLAAPRIHGTDARIGPVRDRDGHRPNGEVRRQFEAGHPRAPAALQVGDEHDLHSLASLVGGELPGDTKCRGVSSADGSGRRFAQRGKGECAVGGEGLHDLRLVVEQHERDAVARAEPVQHTSRRVECGGPHVAMAHAHGPVDEHDDRPRRASGVGRSAHTHERPREGEHEQHECERAQ